MLANTPVAPDLNACTENDIAGHHRTRQDIGQPWQVSFVCEEGKFRGTSPLERSQSHDYPVCVTGECQIEAIWLFAECYTPRYFFGALS